MILHLQDSGEKCPIISVKGVAWTVHYAWGVNDSYLGAYHKTAATKSIG